MASLFAETKDSRVIRSFGGCDGRISESLIGDSIFPKFDELFGGRFYLWGKVNFLIIEGMIICRAESDKQSFFIVKVEMNELVS